MYYPVAPLLFIASSCIIFFSGCTNPFSKCTSCKENRAPESSSSDKDSMQKTTNTAVPDDLEADDDQDAPEQIK